jgi:hypothetical protein
MELTKICNAVDLRTAFNDRIIVKNFNFLMQAMSLFSHAAGMKYKKKKCAALSNQSAEPWI